MFTRLVSAMLLSAAMLGSGLVGFLPNRSVSDQELETAIKRRVAMDGRIDPRGTQIKVNQGMSPLRERSRVWRIRL